MVPNLFNPLDPCQLDAVRPNVLIVPNVIPLVRLRCSAASAAPKNPQVFGLGQFLLGVLWVVRDDWNLGGGVFRRAVH